MLLAERHFYCTRRGVCDASFDTPSLEIFRPAMISHHLLRVAQEIEHDLSASAPAELLVPALFATADAVKVRNPGGEAGGLARGREVGPLS